MTNDKWNSRFRRPLRPSSFVVRLLTLLIRLYQLTFSPLQTFLFGAGSGCRFTPTCSQYAREAVEEHGPLAGSWLAVRRVCRCHPFGSCGHDPVPRKQNARTLGI